jgi:hypothetical protein
VDVDVLAIGEALATWIATGEAPPVMTTMPRLAFCGHRGLTERD